MDRLAVALRGMRDGDRARAIALWQRVRHAVTLAVVHGVAMRLSHGKRLGLGLTFARRLAVFLRLCVRYELGVGDGLAHGQHLTQQLDVAARKRLVNRDAASLGLSASLAHAVGQCFGSDAERDSERLWHSVGICLTIGACGHTHRSPDAERHRLPERLA